MREPKGLISAYEIHQAEFAREIRRIQSAAVFSQPPITPAITPTAKPGYCRLCAGSGKLDRGNGATKPCDCEAGLIERARRRSLRARRKES
jgi:hypothetical protein